MLRGSLTLLAFVLAVLTIPVCYAQSAPQHVRDYIYDPSGRLILTAEPSPYPPGAPPSFSAGMAGECADSGVAMNWGTATDVGPGIAGYNLYRDGSSLGGFGVSTHDYTDYSVYGGSSYTYSVTSVDRAGNESDPTYQGVSVPLCFCRYLFPELFPKLRRGATTAGVSIFGKVLREPAPAILASSSTRLPALPRYSQSAPLFGLPAKLFVSTSFASVRPPNLFDVKHTPRKQATGPTLRTTNDVTGGGR